MGPCDSCGRGGAGADLYVGVGGVALGMVPAPHPARLAGTEQAIDVWGLRKENPMPMRSMRLEAPARPGMHVTTLKGARSSLKALRMLQAVRSVHLLPDLEKGRWLSPAALKRLMRSQPPRSCATDVSPRPGAVTLRKGTKAAGPVTRGAQDSCRPLEGGRGGRKKPRGGRGGGSCRHLPGGGTGTGCLLKTTDKDIFLSPLWDEI